MSKASGQKAVATGQLRKARAYRKLRRTAIWILERELNRKDVVDLIVVAASVLREVE